MQRRRGEVTDIEVGRSLGLAPSRIQLSAGRASVREDPSVARRSQSAGWHTIALRLEQTLGILPQ